MFDIKDLLNDRSGQFAIILGLLAVPVVGAAALAIDYTRAVNVKTHLQDEMDKLALAIVAKGAEEQDEELIASASKALGQALNLSQTLGNVEVTGKWIDAGDFRMTGTVDVDTTLGKILYGGPMQVSATAVARYKGKAYRYEIPEFAELDPEAWDYNEISVYCYDEEKDRRSRMTPIADNDGDPDDYDYEMPVCEAGEALGIKLTNVREAKHRGVSDPLKSKTLPIHTYYSDTTIRNGIEEYHFSRPNILETVLCDSLEECVGTDQGGIIPRGKNRKPVLADEPCAEGKYRYYGFEDRPPSGSSDKDYDDIRIIIECPVVVSVGNETVRLLR